MNLNNKILLLCSLMLSSGFLAEGKARELYERRLLEEPGPKLMIELRDMANNGAAQA